MLTVGSQGLYEWLVTDQQFDLLQICPEVVLGKYVAVTSFDSGALTLNEMEKAAGWKSHANIAYSPKVQAIENLPRAGWDEWYVFSNPAELGSSHLEENIFEVPEGPGHIGVFVNYRFALHLADLNDLARLFWRQVERIRPESYIADNDYLNFVSADETLFAAVRDAIKALH
jgi:hypothetical protein